MQFTNLPAHKATPLLVLLACSVGAVCAGAIPLHHRRRAHDPRSPTPHAPAVDDRAHSVRSTGLDRTPAAAAAGHEVAAARPRQRALFVNDKRARDVPIAVSDWFQDNGTMVPQRVARAAGGTCEIVRYVEVRDQGTCIQVGSMSACSTDTHLDLTNADCSTTR